MARPAATIVIAALLAFAGNAGASAHARTGPRPAGPESVGAGPSTPRAAGELRAQSPSASGGRQAAAGDNPWRGPSGEPLPFRSHEEALDFLRAAEVVSRHPLPHGVTKPEKVLLERNGIRAHAIFRSYQKRLDAVVDPETGRVAQDAFVDSAMSEAAAYELARMLDLPFVPPTVQRTVNNHAGTVQLWIENATTAGDLHEKGQQPPHADWWRGVMQTLVIFDNLLFNPDRHADNLLIDEDWAVWFIDHTRAFPPRRELRNPDAIDFAERRLWLRLHSLPDDEIRARLNPYLGGHELMALLARRERLVRHIEKLIEERGEGAVLFEYSYDLSAWR